MAQAGEMSSSVFPAAGLGTLRSSLLQGLPAVLNRSRPTAQDRLYRGQGQPLIVFPLQDRGADSTERLRGTLADVGFAPHDWGQGVNTGPGRMGLGRWLRKLEECVIDVFETTQRPVTLLGWGVSGFYARELAKRASPLVRQVITLGTPFNTAADPHRLCPLFRLLDAGAERMPLAVRHGLRRCPPVPFTSIYSKHDGVVRWQQCLEVETPRSENIEVAGVRHHELPEHPRVLEIITQRLAQPDGQWRPFRTASALLA
jgi:hypothetical protein